MKQAEAALAAMTAERRDSEIAYVRVVRQNAEFRERLAQIEALREDIGVCVKMLTAGDLSEAALGWCTYGGDQTSGYHVNASIPKTLVRSLVRHAAENLEPDARALVHDILDTPVSPELTGDGKVVTQHTEDIIGPYELHDFFLYHFVRWAEPKRKIRFLARHAFDGKYDEPTVNKWLDVFVDRFYSNQWKRQAMPDGPKVGMSLGPRGDWRMPPDIQQPLRKQLERSGVL